MLKHCTYDKVKLLHELSSLLWFIENHAKSDAQKAEDKQCYEVLEKLAKDLEKYVAQLHDSLHSGC